LETFENLNQQGIPYFIITSRLRGLNIEQMSKNINQFPSNYEEERRTNRVINCIKKSVKFMYEALPQLSRNNNPLRVPDGEVLIIPHSHVGRIYASSIVCENVIFAGSKTLFPNNKGKAIINFMALGILPTADQFDYFICVDDKLMQLQAVQEAFGEAGISGKLIGLWYEQRPSMRDQSLCVTNFSMGECFLSNE
jgi:hypothetical protein